MKEKEGRFIICWAGKRRDGKIVKGCGPFAHDQQSVEYLAGEMMRLTDVNHYVYPEGKTDG